MDKSIIKIKNNLKKRIDDKQLPMTKDNLI